jgi:hypothetical protein
MLTPRTEHDKREIIRARSYSFVERLIQPSTHGAQQENALISPKGLTFNNQYGTLNRSFYYNNIINRPRDK